MQAKYERPAAQTGTDIPAGKRSKPQADEYHHLIEEILRAAGLEQLDQD
ncbi:MAG: hypothetical protein AB2385_01635 [Symbiobacterium sp.]